NALQDQGVPWPDHERVAFGLTKADMSRMEQPPCEATTASPDSCKVSRNQEIDTGQSATRSCSSMGGDLWSGRGEGSAVARSLRPETTGRTMPLAPTAPSGLGSSPQDELKSYLLLEGDAGRLPLADRSVDLVFGSPPYCDARTYGIAAQRDCGEWIRWMLA